MWGLQGFEPLLSVHLGAHCSLAWSPDSSALLVCPTGGVPRALDVAGGRREAAARHGEHVPAELLALASYADDNRCTAEWSSAQRRYVSQFTGHAEQVCTVVCCPRWVTAMLHRRVLPQVGDCDTRCAVRGVVCVRRG